MNLKTFCTVLLCIIVTGVCRAQTGHAGSGCGTSPENPTVILALVGSAGGALVSLRRRFFKK